MAFHHVTCRGNRRQTIFFDDEDCRAFLRYLTTAVERFGWRPYHDEPVERDEHFMETCRYIVRNPVRAGLVDWPGEWRWSSYRATGGIELRPGLLCVEFVRDVFGSTRAYREFCNQVASNLVAS